MVDYNFCKKSQLFTAYYGFVCPILEREIVVFVHRYFPDKQSKAFFVDTKKPSQISGYCVVKGIRYFYSFCSGSCEWFECSSKCNL